MWWIFLVLNAGAGDIEFDVGKGDSVVVKAVAESVFVPACRGVSWSRYDASTGKFEPTNANGCGPLAPSIKVGADGTEFAVDVPLPPLPEVGFHVLRPTVVYGVKCTEESAFPLSSCARIETVDGPQLVVRNRGSATVLGPPKKP